MAQTRISPDWHFREYSRGARRRNPTLDAHFADTTNIANIATALVREGIQNSLDAAIEGQPIQVRLYVSERRGSLAPEKAARYFNEASRKHFLHRSVRLPDPPADGEPCSFLVFEDFGTRGLRGSPEAEHPTPGKPNDFYYYFRAEGDTDKGDKRLGRWGVGKIAFAATSRLRAVFGLTVQSDSGERLLLGQASVRTHRIGDCDFEPDGMFGLDDRGLVLPVVDKQWLDQFCRDWKLSRTSEPGLSVIVPYCEAATGSGTILRAVLAQFFMPILDGQLSVVLETDEARTEITSDNVQTLVRSEGELEATIPLVELASWGMGIKSAKRHTISELLAINNAEMRFEDVPAQVRDTIREDVGAIGRVVVRVPVEITHKDRSTVASYFDIFLEAVAGGPRTLPLFVREGLIVPNSGPRTFRHAGYRSILYAVDPPLAEFLGDAENPAHTTWDAGTPIFRERYMYGANLLKFIRGAPANLVKWLTGTSSERDYRVLSTYFSAPRGELERLKVVAEVDGVERRGRPGKSGGKKPGITRNPQAFKVHRVEGGFVVEPTESARYPMRLQVEMAYDVRSGNPLKHYEPNDFVTADLDVVPSGVRLIKHGANQLTIEVLEQSGRMEVRGFDLLRDLYVRVNQLGGADD